VLALCEKNEIPLVPYFSLIHSAAKKDARIGKIMEKHKATEAQINIAWLLHRSPWILPIPGTSSLKHFEENMQSTGISLTEEDMAFLD
jgi:pyridoxine 4-dehydrogenase